MSKLAPPPVSPSCALALLSVLGACSSPAPRLRSVEILGHGGRVTAVASSVAAGIVCAAGTVGGGASSSYSVGSLVGDAGDSAHSFVHCETGPGRPLFTQVLAARSSFAPGVAVFDDGVVVVSAVGRDIESPFGVFTGSVAIAFDATGAPLWHLPGWVQVIDGIGLHLQGGAAAQLNSAGHVGAPMMLVPRVAGGTYVIDDVVFDRDHVYVASHYDGGFSPDIEAFSWTGERIWHADNPAPTRYTTVGGLALVEGRLFAGLSHLDHDRLPLSRFVEELRAADGTPSGHRIDRLRIEQLGYYSLCSLPGALGVTNDSTFYVAPTGATSVTPALHATATGADNTNITACAPGLDGDALVVGNFRGLTESFGTPLESGPRGAMYLARVEW